MLHLFTKNALAVCLTACCLFLANAEIEATTYTFNGPGTDWATASNWSTGVVPTTGNLLSGDAVVIDANCTMNDVTISFPSGTSLTVNSGKALSPSLNTYITISSGATLTVQASGSISQGRITNSGTMNISGSYTAFYMTNNSGGQFNILSGGSYSCPACAEAFNVGGTINNSGTMHAGTGSTWQGTINNNAGGTITDGGNGAQIQLGASSTMHNYGSFVSRTAGTSGLFNNYSTGTLTMPGTCNFTVKNGATFTNDGTVTLPSSDNFFNINSGGTVTNDATFKGIGTLTQSGTFTNSAAADINPGNSPGKLTITGSLDLGSATYNCEINGTGQGSGYDWLAISGAATLTNATLNVTWGFTPSAGQSFSVITFGSRTGEFATVNIPPVSGLIFTVTHSAAAVTISVNSSPVTYTFTGSGNWNSSGNWDANGIPPNPLLSGDNIVINGSGTATMNVSQTINAGATLSVSAGKTLEISGGFTLTNNGVMTVDGTLTKSNASSVLTNSATGTISISSGGALNNSTGSFTNSGTLTTSTGGTFDNSSGTFTNSGTYNNGGTHSSTYGSFSNSGTITNTGSMSSGQYINIGNTGTWTNTSGASMTMSSLTNSGGGSLTNNGTMNVGLTNSSTFMNIATFSVSYFSLINNSTGTWTNAVGATHTTTGVPFSNAGTFHNNGTFTMNPISGLSSFANSGTFNCAGTMTLNPDQGGTNAATKTINLTGTMNVQNGFTNSGTISGGGTLNITGNSFTNNGSISNPALLTIGSNGSLTVASGSTLTTTVGSNTNINNLGTLTIASGNSTTLGGQVDVNSGGTLAINGSLTTTFTFSNNSGGILNGSGTLTPTGGLTNNSFIRPGNSPGTLTVTGSLDLGSGTYTAEINGTSQGTTYDLLNITGTATIGASSKLALVFGYAAVNGTTYDVLTAGAVSGTFVGGNISFSNTGAGNVTAISVSYPGGNVVRVTVTSPLPVELVSFTGKATQSSVQLEWQTASELNNEGFYVERMTGDGGLWTEIGFVPGSGTTTETHNYSFLDETVLASPLEGVRGVFYYRLRQTDFDRGEELSKVVSVDFRNLQDFGNLRVFPNPVVGGELTLLLPENMDEKSTVLLYCPTGQLVRSATMSSGANSLDIRDLAVGIYSLMVWNSTAWLFEKIVVQN